MFTERSLRALGLRNFNNLDAKCLPVSRLDGDQWLEMTPPYVTPVQDAGRGASASASIAVVTASGVVPVLPDGDVTPAGWIWQRPALTGSETWYPLGNHAQGRWSFSERYGPLLNETTCLYPDGSVKKGIAAFTNWRSARENKWWKTIGRPGTVLAWDANRGTDLCAVGNNLYALEESAQIATLGRLVATLPSAWMDPSGSWHVWDDWNAFITHRVFLPWVNELWTVQLKAGAYDQIPVGIWWVKCDGSNAHGDIVVPQEVQDHWLGGNLCLTADADNQRVVAAQSQYGSTFPTSDSAKFPLGFWIITGNGANPVWTKSDLTTPNVLLIGNGTTGRTPFQHIGHDRFLFAAPRVPYYDATVTVDPDGRKRVSEGYEPIEIQLPGPKPRKLTLTTFDCSAWAPETTGQHASGKHSHWTYRPATGELIQFGGDFEGFPHDESYRQDMYALKPRDPTSHRQVQPYAPDANNPCISRPDECTWVWDAQLDVGYALRGMFACMGQPLAANTFLPSKAAIYDPKLANHRWSEMVLTGSGAWPTFENSKRGAWDPARRRIVRVADSGGTLCFNRVDVDARSYETFFFSTTTNIRPPDADLSNMGSLLCTEYVTLNPATGFLYAHDWLRGDLYEIDTRAVMPTMRWVLRTNAQASSENQTHLTWMAGCLLMVVRMNSGRARIYSWEPGESAMIEHPVPPNTRINQLATFVEGGIEKAFGIGCEGWHASFEYYILAFA